MKKFTLLLALLSITIVVSAKKIYLDPWQWSSDDAKFTAWGWKDDSEGSMYTMNYDEAAQLYVVELSDEINNIIFLRKSPNHDLTNWDCWNQTIDLAIPSDKNKFTINNWNVQDNKSGGEWSTFENNTGNNGDNDNPEKPQPESSVYTLCGDSIIFGTNWEETDTNNDMTKGEDGIWVKEYTDVTLSKGTYEYKVVADHNWDTAGKYPSDDSNMTLYIAKDGVYDLKFTFDPTIPELKAFATNKVNVENVMINNIYAINGFIYAETDITIYTVTGQDVTSQNGNLQNGVYIIKAQNETSKLIINN